MSWLSDLMGWVRLGCKVVFGLSGVAIGLLYVFQDKMLYMPNPPGFPETPDKNPPGFRSPKEWSVRGRRLEDDLGSSPIPYESEMLETSDGQKIHVWLMYQTNASRTAPTLLYFHGNAGNMGFRLQNAAQMYATCGINVLMMDYRGYGRSSGVPTETGLKIDAATVVSWASRHPRLQGSPLVAFGRSLGGAVSMDLAQKYPSLIKGVVVENTFLSISAMVDKLMPAVAPLKHLVLRIDWKTDVAVKSLKQPILFISGDSDELVPPSHMRKLHEMATKAAFTDFFLVEGGTHNDTWNRAGKAYYSRLRAFMTRIAEMTNAKLDQHEDGVDDEECLEGAGALPTMTTDFRVQ